MWWITLFLMQDVASQADRVRDAMSASIERQRESIKKQQAAVRTTPAGLHAAGWTPPTASFACDPIPQPELTQMIGETAQRVGIDGGIVREVARQESGFRPCAVSPKGAEGLMQLMPATQAQFAVSNPFDPKESLEAGSKLLKQLLDRYQGNLSLALSAYNAGAACVDQSGGVPNIQETRNYVFDILSRFSGFQYPSASAPLLRKDPLTPGGGCQPAPAQIDNSGNEP